MTTKKAKSKTLAATTNLDKINDRIVKDIESLKTFLEDALPAIVDDSDLNDSDTLHDSIEKSANKVDELSEALSDAIEVVQEVIDNIQDAITNKKDEPSSDEDSEKDNE